jgi:hypothetical protein
VIVRYLTPGTTHTYSGNTTISAGTLALSATASIANTPIISIAGGATYDVSAATAATVGAGTLGAGQTLEVSGSTNSGTLATAADHGLTLNAISPLKFTAFKPGGSGGAVPLTLSGAGTLTLGANSPVTVTVANGGTPLSAAGSPYKLIAKGDSGTVATLPGGLLTVNGDGAAGVASLQINNGELELVITCTPPSVGDVSPASQAACGGGSAIFTVSASGTALHSAVLILAFQPLRLRVDGRIKPVSSPVGRVADVPDGGSVGWMVRCGCVRTKFWRSESWTPRDPRLLGAVLL